MRSFATILLALSLPLHAFASHQINRRYHSNITLPTRQDGYRFTYYDITVGTTACGGNYAASDFVVAINADQFGNIPGQSKFCGASITITCNGKTANAVVVDKCQACPYRGLDLTQGLFEFFAPTSLGVIYGGWTGGPGGGGDNAPKAPTTSYTPQPRPTTHYNPPTTSSTYSPPPSSTSSSTTSKTSTSVSSAPPTTTQHSTSASNATHTSVASYNNAPASSLAQPSGTIAPGQNQAINNLYEAMIGLGTVVMALNP